MKGRSGARKGGRGDRLAAEGDSDKPTTWPGWKIDQLDYPTFRLTLVAKIMDRLTIRYLSVEGDLTYAEWRVMMRLATMADGGTIGEIADLASVDRAEVSRAASSLQAKGWSDRRGNPLDRRTPLIFLTPQGRERYDVAIRQRVAFHESLLVNLSGSERAELDELLARIGDRLLQMSRSSVAEMIGKQ